MTPEQTERLIVAVERCADALSIIAAEQYAPPEPERATACPHPADKVTLTAGNPPGKWCAECEERL